MSDEDRTAVALERLADATERVAVAAESNAEATTELLTYWRAREARDMRDAAIRDQGDAIKAEQMRVSLAIWDEQHRVPS